MKNLFNSVKMTKLQTNMFDMSHDVKLSCNMGQLVPIMLMECIPGDRHEISCEALIRFAPMIAPVMHRYDVTMHYFFVPNRILWKNWTRFITNQKDGLNNPFQVPSFRIDAGSGQGGVPYTKLMDYLGVPKNQIVTNTADETINAMPFAAYQKVYNEYYRDQNLIGEIYLGIDGTMDDGDQSGNTELFNLRYRAWEHDYFTACLPFAQKGEAVDIPLGEVILQETTVPNVYPAGTWINSTGGGVPASGSVRSAAGSGTATDANGFPVTYDPNGSLVVGPTSINDLRRAFRLQEWLEKAARGGSRYIEWLKVMFGVNSSDKRLQRPEYITGTKSPVVISEVLNTTGTDSAPQGNMAGHGVSVTNGYKESYYVEEHGFIIGIMSIMPKPAYQQGFEKHWLKISDPTQYYFSSFANIGEQEVLNKEIVAYSNTGNGTFGYIPRYAEYRYIPNRVAGDFRDSLRFWHHGRIFETDQNLNQQFIECNPDTRVFAVIDEDVDKVYCQVYNKINSIRPIPKYGTPTF